VDEWRLALEGFGLPEDFAGASRVLASSRRWRSVTPFLAPGHLKKAEGEVRRLLRRRGFGAETVAVDEIKEIDVGGAPRRALNSHRFRSRGRERRHDSSGALLEIELLEEVRGPLALGYGSHFGLGMFGEW
jgi:CRISPR-associated protein Csb2